MKVASQVNGRLRPESGTPAAVNFNAIWYGNGQEQWDDSSSPYGIYVPDCSAVPCVKMTVSLTGCWVSF